MPNRTVVSIQITPQNKEPMIAVDSVRAQAGCGLEGDRFFYEEGVSDGKRKGYQVTLIEREAIEAVNRDHNIPIQPIETRRNIVTQHVALNHLVGKTFQVGNVKMRGVSLCEPCMHLQKLTYPGTLKAFVHRGGLRAEILSDGVIQSEDEIQIFESE